MVSKSLYLCEKILQIRMKHLNKLNNPHNQLMFNQYMHTIIDNMIVKANNSRLTNHIFEIASSISKHPLVG